MVLYHYRARTPQGKTLDGTVEAPSERDAARVLRSRGLLVSTLTDNRQLGEMTWSTPRPNAQLRAAASSMAPPGTKGALGFLSFGGGVSLRDLSLFCRQFATMINAGVPILTSLNILTRQTASRRLRNALSDISLAIEHGQSLSDAFRSRSDAFPPIITNMVSAGETGGILEECFDRLADHFEKEHAVAQKVKSAMAYPAVVSVVAVGVLILMILFVLPSFVGIFAQIGGTLPASTQAIMNLSDFLRSRWYLALGVVVLLAVGAKLYAATPGGAYTLDSIALKFPVLGKVTLMRAVSRFSRTLGTLLRSGVPLLVALSVVERTVGSRPVAAAIIRAEDEIRAGRGIVEPLRASKLFPNMVLEMMGVGEETGAIDTMLNKVADFYDKEVDAAVGRLASMIEPLIMVVIGSMVGFLLVSLITPMFDVYSQLNL